MKKTIILIFFCIILPNKSFSKILEVGSNSLDVPNKFYLYNWSNSSFNGQLNLCSDEFVNCFGLIDKKLKEVKIFKPKIFNDSRGFFFESYNNRTFSEVTGLNYEFKTTFYFCTFSASMPCRA